MAPLDDTVHLFVIERPSEATIDEAIDIFCASLVNDPPAIAFTGGDASRMRALARATLAPFASTPGAAHVIAAADAEGEIVAASFWTVPGKPGAKELDKRREMLDEYLAELPDDVREDTRSFFNVHLPSLLDNATGIKNAEVECYECEMVIVRPDHQGHGIARAMFDLAEHKADAMGAKMLLWTGSDSTVKVYQKFGFELRTSSPVQSSAHSWTIHVLTRDPPSIS